MSRVGEECHARIREIGDPTEAESLFDTPDDTLPSGQSRLLIAAYAAIRNSDEQLERCALMIAATPLQGCLIQMPRRELEIVRDAARCEYTVPLRQPGSTPALSLCLYADRRDTRGRGEVQVARHEDVVFARA